LADIAIIYAREDKPLITALDAALRKCGWSVWWDDLLTGDAFPKEIQAQLEAAGCVVVVWSRHSSNKEWVREEGRFVKERGRPLIQVKAEKVVVPIGFGQDEAIELMDWQESQPHAGFERLKRRIERSIGVPTPRWDGKRVLQFQIEGKNLTLPTFFRSVSSYETQLRPDAAIQALELLNTEAVLASAYDVARAENKKAIVKGLHRLRAKGSVVLLDSGNYEAYRKNDKTWSANQFRRALIPGSFDFAFCYDNLKPPGRAIANVKDVVSRVRRDQEVGKTPNILPIVHIPIRKGNFHTDVAPQLFVRIAEELQPKLIAVPERELGGGIIEKAQVVWEIRKALNQLSWYQPIHLLGTGNPLSLAVFAAAGADTFDGLEWCRTTADHETALLYHFQQYDFFRHQTRSAQSPVVRAAADAAGISFNARVAFHNLEFFRVWCNDIQQDIAHARIGRLLRDFLPKGSFHQLTRALPGVFDQ
jgi:queuine/archaeosine tRNA-ribosyltransferase